MRMRSYLGGKRIVTYHRFVATRHQRFSFSIVIFTLIHRDKPLRAQLLVYNCTSASSCEYLCSTNRRQLLGSCPPQTRASSSERVDVATCRARMIR